MKKVFFSLSVFFALSILLCACAPARDNMLNKPLNEYLISNSIDMTCTMDNLAQSTEYIKMVSSTLELDVLITGMGAEEYTSPSQAVLITVPDETIDVMIKNEA